MAENWFRNRLVRKIWDKGKKNHNIMKGMYNENRIILWKESHYGDTCELNRTKALAQLYDHP